MGQILSNQLEGWGIDGPSGTLSQLADSPYTVSASAGVSDVAITPDGKFLYACRLADGVIAGFNIDAASGNLKPLNALPFTTGRVPPEEIAIDADGRFLYAASPSGIVELQIDPSTGALTTLTGPTFPAGMGLTLPATVVVEKTN